MPKRSLRPTRRGHPGSRWLHGDPTEFLEGNARPHTTRLFDAVGFGGDGAPGMRIVGMLGATVLPAQLSALRPGSVWLGSARPLLRDGFARRVHGRQTVLPTGRQAALLRTLLEFAQVSVPPLRTLRLARPLHRTADLSSLRAGNASSGDLLSSSARTGHASLGHVADARAMRCEPADCPLPLTGRH